MRLVISIILGSFLLFLALQSHLFYERGALAESELREVETQLEKVKNDSEAIRSDREYYANPMNLEKELRARFNYRSGDEQILILVPGSSTTKP
jgi:hypothetical protein